MLIKLHTNYNIMQTTTQLICATQHSVVEDNSIKHSMEMAQRCHREMRMVTSKLNDLIQNLEKETALVAKRREEIRASSLQVLAQAKQNQDLHPQSIEKAIISIRETSNEQADELQHYLVKKEKQVADLNASTNQVQFDLVAQAAEVNCLKQAISNLH